MLLPDPEYPWKWNWRVDGQPSEYFGFNTVGSGTILHKEHLKHFRISASSSFNRDKAMLLLFTPLALKTGDVDLYARTNALTQTGTASNFLFPYI